MFSASWQVIEIVAMQPTILNIILVEVRAEDGLHIYATFSTPEAAFQRGLKPEEIIGELIDPTVHPAALKPTNFARNATFVDFLHRVIAQYGPSTPGLLAAARQQREGIVHLIDARTLAPDEAVPLEDIIGVFNVHDGRITHGSYRRNPDHRIFSVRGFFQLEETRQQHLLDELAILTERE